MRSIFFKIIFFLIFFCWSNVSYSVEVLGTGAAALIGGDLTDPEDDGVDGENTNWNWTSISASSEEKWTHEGSFNVFDNNVGSSNNKIFGFPQIALAIATLFCIPPEISEGYRSKISG